MDFRRKNIRLPAHRYVGQSSYFLTFCCAYRRRVFSDSENATWFVENLLDQSNAYGFAVYAYCVMPDHFHALLTGRHITSDLLAFAKNLKQVTGYDYERRCGEVLWQKRPYDHILRESDNFDAVAGYIWMNPVRAGLCADPRDYPYSGSFTMDWKKMMRPLELWVPPWKVKPKLPA